MTSKNLDSSFAGTLFFLSAALTLIIQPGCWSGDSNDDVGELVAMLPSATRGALTVDVRGLLAGDSSEQFVALLKGEGTEAAVTEPFAAMSRRFPPLDIARSASTVVFAHPTDIREGGLLVAKLNPGAFAELLSRDELVEEELYSGRAAYSHAPSGTYVVALPADVFVAGEVSRVRATVDVYEGKALAAAETDPIGPYLPALSAASPINFAYGLPAMYREVKAGATLEGARAISVALSFSAGVASGTASLYTATAVDFVDGYNLGLKGYDLPPLEVAAGYEAGVERIDLNIPAFAPESDRALGELLASRHRLKMLFPIMAMRDHALGIASGEAKPWKNFFVDSTPPSIFINFEIPESQVAAFSARVLPAGFEMKKIQILESDPSQYTLSLNAYTALGIAPGVRFEWSVFVKDPDGDKPRFMVIEALAAEMSLDPVDLFTGPKPVSHALDIGKGLLVSEALQGPAEREIPYFSSSIAWPQATPTPGRTTREFAAANDYIYWGGGVADRGLYSGSMHNRDVIVIPPGEYEIIDDTPWAEFVSPVPSSVYVYQGALDIVVSPWWNLDREFLDVSPEHLAELVSLKKNIYPRMIAADVASAFAARLEPVIPFVIRNEVPSLLVNFTVSDARAPAFEAALGLPDGFRLERTRILESDADEAYLLSLRVFDVEGAIEGTRAEWTVYVDDGGGREHMMVIETMSADAGLDPVRLLRLPSVVEHDLVGDELTTVLSSAGTHFAATLDVTAGTSALQTLDWVEAYDQVCSLNGICDQNYSDGATISDPLTLIDPTRVQLELEGRWSEFIEAEPHSVLIRSNFQQLVRKPWRNVQPSVPPAPLAP